MEENKRKLLQNMIDESNKIVFFGGAGVSTESGLKDFRSVDGLYHLKYAYPPETILSLNFFYEHPKEFYSFYKENLLKKGIQPNACHYKLKELEDNGKLLGIITQNIDHLHTLAGSKNVIELHGSIVRNHCIHCHKFFPGWEFIDHCDYLPLCDKCNQLIKPDVVLYGESLNEKDILKAIEWIEKADLLIIGGCSLQVYPAASFIHYFKGKYLVIINKTPTPADSLANLLIDEPIGKVMESIQISKTSKV